MASGGPSHGRKYGLGSKLSRIEMPTETARGRAPTYSGLDASGVATQQRLFTAQEVLKMLEERDKRYADDRAYMQQKEAERNATTNFHISRLYAILGLQMPLLPAGTQGIPTPPQFTDLNSDNGGIQATGATKVIPTSSDSQATQGDEANNDGQATQTNTHGNIMDKMTALLFQGGGNCDSDFSF